MFCVVKSEWMVKERTHYFDRFFLCFNDLIHNLLFEAHNEKSLTMQFSSPFLPRIHLRC